MPTHMLSHICACTCAQKHPHTLTCVCTHTLLHTCTHADSCMHTGAHTYTYMQICVYKCAIIRIHRCPHACTRVHMLSRAHADTCACTCSWYTRTCSRTHVHVHAHTYTCTCSLTCPGAHMHAHALTHVHTHATYPQRGARESPQLRGRDVDGLGRRGTARFCWACTQGYPCHLAHRAESQGGRRSQKVPSAFSPTGRALGFRERCWRHAPSFLESGLHRPAPPSCPAPLSHPGRSLGARPGRGMKGPYPAGLLTSRRLPVFCQLILKIGNFLNYVSGQQPARHCSQTPDPTPPPGQGTPSPPPPRRAATLGTPMDSR